MQTKYVFLVPVLLLAITNTHAQRVKRKGVEPVDISKNKRGNTVQGPIFILEQLNGKWQETSRTDTKNNAVGITDTIYLHFTAPNKVTTRDGNHGNMSGEAAIDAPGNVLLAAADVYTIISASTDKLVLDDQDKYIHTLTKTDSFPFEKYGNLSVNQDEYKNPVPVKMADILGNWAVYRRLAKPGVINPPTNIIRFLKVTNKTSDSTATGEITFYQSEQSEAKPCTISLSATQLLIAAGDKTWKLYMYKAAGKEIVFGEAEVLLYYAKPM